MKNKKELDPKTKRINAIIFFVFYIAFFTLMFQIFKTVNIEEQPKKENINIRETKTYSIEKILVNKPIPTIIIKENNKNIYLTKDYNYKYFLKIENINQIVKKGKLIKSNITDDSKNSFEYEIKNKEINNLLKNNFELNEELIKITIYVNNIDITKITIDLTNYVKQFNDIISYNIEIDYENDICNSIECENYIKEIIYEV